MNNRWLITCTCAVRSSLTFNASLVDGRLACSKPRLYCAHPVVSGLSGLSSRCISKATESGYFYYNKDYGSIQEPEFNITFDSLCPPNYLWLQLNGKSAGIFNSKSNGIFNGKSNGIFR